MAGVKTALSIALCVSLAGCITGRPPRPADPVGLHREGYDSCERTYSECTTGRSGYQHVAGRPDRELRNDYDQGRCSEALQRCYDEESKKLLQPAPSAPGLDGQ